MKKIVAPGICLRAYETDDADVFAAVVRESVETVGRWMGWCHADFNSDHAREWFAACDKAREEGTAYEFGIFSEDGKVLLGGAGLNMISKLHSYCNLGYWIRQSEQGKGIATRATMLLADAGFRELGFNRIEIVAAQGNINSIAVAKKVGAQLECLARNRLIVGGLPVTAAVHSLLREDWQASLTYDVQK